MICEFYWCIYNKKKECLLKEISINVFGVCNDAITVSIPEDKMNELKENQLGYNVKYILQQTEN